MKWLASATAILIACAAAFVGTAPARAQQQRDPLIDPPSGGAGTRFQVVGQRGWRAGETVTLRVGFAATDPLRFTGPFPFERTLTVLPDGTWSFPVNVNDDLLGTPLPETPGYLVVQASTAGQTAANAYVYTPGGQRPPGAEVLAPLGFGPEPPPPVLPITLALFAAGTGALVTLSGAARRRWRD